MENYIEILLRLLAISSIRYFVIAGIPFLLFYKLLTVKFSRSKIQAKHAGSGDFFREIVHSLQSTVVISLIAVVVLFSPLRAYTKIYTDLDQFGSWYLALSIISALIIHDTYFYWTHRLLHHPKLFRHAHLTHHRSVNPSPWTSYSFHIFEALVEGAVLIVLVTILPMHRLAIILFVLLSFMINVYGHLGYEIMPKWFRRTWFFEVFSTSMYHNLHHSKFKGNYGLYFRFWDRLMGTENPDYKSEYDRIQSQRF